MSRVIDHREKKGGLSEPFLVTKTWHLHVDLRNLCHSEVPKQACHGLMPASRSYSRGSLFATSSEVWVLLSSDAFMRPFWVKGLERFIMARRAGHYTCARLRPWRTEGEENRRTDFWSSELYG